MPRFGHISAELGWTNLRRRGSLVQVSSSVGWLKDLAGRLRAARDHQGSMAITSPIFLGKKWGKNWVVWQFFTVGRPSWSISTFVTTLSLPRSQKVGAPWRWRRRQKWDGIPTINKTNDGSFILALLIFTNTSNWCQHQSRFSDLVCFQFFGFSGVLWRRRGQKWVAHGL